ncbi:MAG: DEAD/DEAH box helicase [Desulfuromonadales bacterium]
MSFTELNLSAPVLKAVLECGYTTPTPIQAKAIPEALLGKDLIASAQTGTGKTAAFMLPALERLATLKKGPKGAPRILVLTPTRELASQVTDATRNYGKYLRVRSAVILGGSPYRDQFKALSQPLDLVVATPGRLIDHLDRGSLDLSRVEILVLDEADRMLDMGFQQDVEKITAATPADRQTLLFTATLDQAMTKLAMALLKNPVKIAMAPQGSTSLKIEQRLHVTDNLEHKQRLLEHLVTDGSMNQAIIFSATKRDADRLAQELSSRGHRAAALHGDMTQGARNRTVRDLRNGRVKLLVATDVAARGIDVTGISHVINFDLPKFAEDYVHRIGRTGRAGASGTAISFASGSDALALQRIERYIGQSLPQHVVPGLEPTRGLHPQPRRTSRKPQGGKPVRQQRTYGKTEEGRPQQRRTGNASRPFGAKPKSEPVVIHRRSR